MAAPSWRISGSRTGSCRRRVGSRSSPFERCEPDADVADREAMQVPRAPARNLLGLGAQQPRELPLEAQPRVLRDYALADGVRDLIAAQPEHVDRCPSR